MKNISICLSVEDEDVDEMFEWAQRLLNNNHAWLPGLYFAFVKDIKVKKEEQVASV